VGSAVKILKGGAILIGIYLGLAYATNGGKLLISGKDAAVPIIKVFQGRG